jgi:hypothetical protein
MFGIPQVVASICFAIACSLCTSLFFLDDKRAVFGFPELMSFEKIQKQYVQRVMLHMEGGPSCWESVLSFIQNCVCRSL